MVVSMRTFSRNLAAIATATTLALSGTAVATAQSPLSSLSSASSGSAPTVPTSPAPTYPSPARADEAAEEFRSAIEYYHVTRFGSYVDPSLQPAADVCAEKAAEGEIPIRTEVDMRHFGYPGASCSVYVSSVPMVSVVAKEFRLRALEEYDSRYSLPQAFGGAHDGRTVYASVVYG